MKRDFSRLLKKEELCLEGTVAWLQDEEQRKTWLKELESIKWNAFVEGPPHGKSKPTHVLKYLARYMSGGPIADRRLISHESGEITFWARTRDKANKSEPFSLPGKEFVRRWSLHILPKGYTRSRSYGGFHCSKRADYLKRCRELLEISKEPVLQQAELAERPLPELPKCERCKLEMCCVASSRRPSWREIFTVSVYREDIYSPTLHINFGMRAQAIGGYG